jgi:hypothetical protein
MRSPLERRPPHRPVAPDKEDIGAWIAAVFGLLFTLILLFGYSVWREPVRVASNAITIEKTDPNQPPPRQPIIN